MWTLCDGWVWLLGWVYGYQHALQHVDIVFINGGLSSSHPRHDSILQSVGDQANYVTLKLDGYMAKPYTIKVAALLNSAFEDILFLDADNVAVRDPSYLFDLPEYLDTGAMFFRTQL